MKSITELVIDLFNIKTYEDDFEKLSENHQRLAQEHEEVKKLANSFKEKLREYEYEDEEETAVVQEEEYKVPLEAPGMVFLNEMEFLIAENEKLHKENETIYNRGFAEGRMNAYNEMGIRVIEAHKHGEEVSVKLDEDGNIDEVIEEISEERLNEIAGDEIEIEDIA